MVTVAPSYLSAGWLHAKLIFVALLYVYHVWCYRLLIAFRENRNTHGERWYRLFNESPLVLLIAIVVLAVVKPF
jgi:protoporphyrinogen IX oxidase